MNNRTINTKSVNFEADALKIVEDLDGHAQKNVVERPLPIGCQLIEEERKGAQSSIESSPLTFEQCHVPQQAI